MKISVVIPAYNEEAYIKKILSSLTKQSFPKKDFEVIVVNNNSTDKTVSLAKSYPVRILHEFRQGITYARNTGAFAAKGEIIIGVDADSILPSNYLSLIYSLFEADNKLALVCTAISMPDAPFFIRHAVRFIFSVGKWYTKRTKKVSLWICWGTNYSYRSSDFKKIGGFSLNSALLKKGINTGGTDDSDIIKKFKSSGGKIILEPRLTVTTSSRRFTNRFLYWLVVEYLLGFVVNSATERFGFIMPVPSYYNRIAPKKYLLRFEKTN